MQSSPFKKLLLILLLLAVVAGILLLHFVNSELKPQEKAPPKISRSDFKYHYSPPVISSSTKEVEPERDAAGLPKIPREKVEEWLAKHNRNAMSLLAAFRVLEDTNYLNEAAANFPNDPRVELAVLSRDEFLADRRKWLDLFKASSPSNSLANYLSAQDYFKNGNTNAAIQELLASTGKSQFDGHETDSQLDEEELCLASGKSPLESSEIALAGAMRGDLPWFVTLKRPAHGIGDLEKQHLNSGDNDSAANLAHMGMTLTDQIKSGDSGKYISNQLVGFATESIVLQQLDANTSYDFLNGKTPNQMSGERKQQIASLGQLVQSFYAIQSDMTESEKVNFAERMKIYGEVDALRWAAQQHPPNNP